jgi:hypothetical protein
MLLEAGGQMQYFHKTVHLPLVPGWYSLVTEVKTWEDPKYMGNNGKTHYLTWTLQGKNKNRDWDPKEHNNLKEEQKKELFELLPKEMQRMLVMWNHQEFYTNKAWHNNPPLPKWLDMLLAADKRVGCSRMGR